jgi:hypothetical protein
VVKEDGVAYECVVGRTSHSCTCAAGCFGKVAECCHVAGLKALIENRWLPHPQSRPDPVPLPHIDAGDGPLDLDPRLDITCPRYGCGGWLFEDLDGYCRCDACGYAS